MRSTTGLNPAVSIALRYVLLCLGVLVVAAPFLNMLLTALTDERELFANPGRMFWIPHPIRFDNFARTLTFQNMNFMRAFANTLIIIAVNVTTTTTVSAWVAFGFARLRFPGRKILFIIMLATMMIPTHVKLIPLFIMFSKIGWVNTFFPLMIWGVFGVPFYVFLVRQFIMGIPNELIDAARADGCSNYRIYWRIIYPQLVAVLAAIAVFIFIGEWKHLMGPLLYLREQRLFTIAMELNKFMSLASMTHLAQLPVTNLLMAASVLGMVPPTIVFFVGQKYFLRGLDISGSVKG